MQKYNNICETKFLSDEDIFHHVFGDIKLFVIFV
jgi:hypothetical protein